MSTPFFSSFNFTSPQFNNHHGKRNDLMMQVSPLEDHMVSDDDNEPLQLVSDDE